MAIKPVKVVGAAKATTRSTAVGGSFVVVSHVEAAERITQVTAGVTTKEDARSLLRSAGILNRNNKLVKALA